METPIKNATPRTQTLGINDTSAAKKVYEPIAVPTHLPKVFFYASEGPVRTPIPVVGDARNRVFGDATFDPYGKFFNHATAFANAFNAAPNMVIAERVYPEDGAPAANYRMIADVLPTKLQVYEYNDDGSYKVDKDGNPVPVPGLKSDGYLVKFLTEYIELGADGEDMFGQGTRMPGDQIDPITNTQSERFPLYDIEMSSPGEWGNNAGNRIWTAHQNSQVPVKDYLIDKYGVYPFRFAAIRRPDSGSTAKSIENNDGEQYMELVLKPGFIDKDMNRELDINTAIMDNWRDLKPADGSTANYGPFGRVKVYNANIELLLKKFYAAEFPVSDLAFTDFRGGDEDFWRFNLFGGYSSHGSPYRTYQILGTAAGGLRLTENTNIYASGGTDGTMSDEKFSKLVGDALLDYGNPDHPYTSDALNPESVFYDSGLLMEDKKKAMKFISLRKDLALFLSTTIAGEPQLTAAEDSSRGVMLNSLVQAYPESVYFGTSVARAHVICRSGYDVSKSYRGVLPLAYQIALWYAGYMGAANKIWKETKRPDENPNNIVRALKDLNVTFTSDKVRNKDWSNGLVWCEAYDLRECYVPAIRTSFNDDTSILTGSLTVMACVELQKQGLAIQRMFSGSQRLTRAQLKQRVEKEANRRLNTVTFDGRFNIVPEVIFAADDTQRGYSWHLTYKLAGPGMFTVQTLAIETQRIEDAVQTTA